MMDDIQEQNEIAEEISGALSQPIGFAQELDEVSSTKEHYFFSFGSSAVQQGSGLAS